MAKTWGASKEYIARSNGGEGSADNLALAGDALSSVLARFNTYHEWSWLTMEEQISVVSGTSDYATTYTIRAPYTIRLLTSEITLPHKTVREIDRGWSGLADSSLPQCYTTYRAATFDPQYGTLTRIRIVPTPSVTETALHKYTRMIVQDPTSDNTYVDVRDDILFDVLNYARGEYLLVKNAEDVRARTLLTRGEARLKQLRSWDLMGATDRDKNLVPFDEWSGSGGSASDLTSGITGSTTIIQGESLVPDGGT